MTHSHFLKAGLIGLAVSLTSISAGIAQNNLPTTSGSTLRVVQGQSSATLRVPMNRAVVVETQGAFSDISIANPGIAEISTINERTIYVLGKIPGRTTLTLLTADGQLMANVDVQVSPDIAEFKERLQQILPGEPVEVRTANDGLVLSGVISSIARLDRALDLAERYAPGRVSNLMSVGGTQQVMLKVRFAEMQRSVTKALRGGLNVQIPGTDGSLTFGGGGGNISGSGFSSLPGSQGGAIGSIGIGDVQLAVMLQALESRGVIRTLAEPNLVALSGQEANFLAGGEFPIPVSQRVDETGFTRITVEFKPFGIELSFTPRVVDQDVINLELSAAVSALDPSNSFTSGGLSIPAFTRRETSTTVEMRDGESFAIAGLLQDDFRDLNSQVPWLGDIPILGALFRSADYERDQSELVIVVTAHLVTPTRGEALALPTDRVRPPTEADLFLRGRVASEGNAASGAAAEISRQDFSGSYGYVME
ncbi:type II and III secretion system protein family protein [Halocynthiibacter styelae]|uniref:Type II and III secretion system protein family protein n=1 Tax=Halocynthiibacter styelae TaxID=2761955 RepID=A0A8J7ILK5_9RHOB|nr:type II and III secretion system protein family protein [Paenihalocynthiibacter styelae]MBI1492601.1 type II and III secretion system protein family protein [Paenihalocynthiibacter styelae]